MRILYFASWGAIVPEYTILSAVLIAPIRPSNVSTIWAIGGSGDSGELLAGIDVAEHSFLQSKVVLQIHRAIADTLLHIPHTAKPYLGSLL